MKVVLLAEDNEVVQRMFGRVFSAAGFTVVLAGDGAQAVRLATEQLPDAIVMDAMMPTMSGIEAVKALKADDRTKAIPVAMLSANDDEDMMKEALNAGASRYFVKGVVESTAVVELVREMIGQ